MKRRRMSWRIVAFSSAGRTCGRRSRRGRRASGPSGPSASNAHRRDDGFDHEPRSRGVVRLRDADAHGQRLRAPDGLPHGPKLEPSLATRCFSVGSPGDVALHPAHGRRSSATVRAFDSADVKFSFDRVTNKTIVKEAAANSPSLVDRQSEERHDERQVRGDVPSQVTAGDVALDPRDAGRVHRARRTRTRPNKLMPNTRQQIGTGPYMLIKYTAGQQAVFTRNAELLGHAGEDGQPHHPVLLQVVDDEARDPAGRDRHVVPVVHADRDHVAPEAERSSGLLRARAAVSATS